jgi:disulfide bond formation protein DsbB
LFLSRVMKPILRHWPWVALAASLGMLAIAHAFETFGHLAPCELCLKERQVYWVAIAISALGVALGFTPMKPGRWVGAVLALVFAGGTVLAAYHAGVEWKFWPGPASCTGGALQVTAADLSRFLHGGPVGAPACDKPAWVLLGISMAGWNALISLKLTVLSVLAVRTWKGQTAAR